LEVKPTSLEQRVQGRNRRERRKKIGEGAASEERNVKGKLKGRLENFTGVSGDPFD